MTDFASYIVPVATELWGAPRPGATPTEVRFGEGRTVNPKNGTAFDHGADEGGGVLWLMAADGPRYKQCGNSMAVNVMRWIGRRIALVDEIGGAS